MSIRPIVRLGHPALRIPARAVGKDELADAEIRTLIDDMLETMIDAGGVGLAAPQLGVSRQLFVYLVVDRSRDLAGAEQRVLVNPMIEPVPGDLVYDWEGCLSIPDLRGLVPRHPEVRVYGLDRCGESVRYLAEDYESRIVQHEFDHLNGVIFLDRMRDLRSLAFSAEWREFMVTDEDQATPAAGASTVPPEEPGGG
jgi:peptide deformylase